MENLRPVRKHRTAAQRQALLREYREGQLTQKAFAAHAGISLSTLQAWLRRAPAGGLSLEVRRGFVSEEVAALLQLLSAR